MAQQMEDDDVVPTTSASINLCDSENGDSNDCDAAAAQLANAAASTSAASASSVAAAQQQQQSTVLECPICLQTCIHPTRLPCGHIFCFLCVKGVAYKNRRCAMCRREIPPEFLDHPQLVNGIDDICTTKATEDGYQWFYEGRNGWWQYDDRTSQDIEDAYKKGEKSCTILVAGYVYIVDLETMVQQRQNEPSRCRRVKRDLATVPKKGVAGLRIEGNTVTTDSNFAAAAQRLGQPDFGQPSTRVYHHPMHLQRYLQRQQLLANVIGDDDVDDDDDDDDDDDEDDEGGRRAGRRPRQPLHSLNLPLDYGLHLASDAAGDFIASMTATDAAIRIASDIIGSTLAHADELTGGVAVRGGQQPSTVPETPNPTPTSAHAGGGGVSLLDSLAQAHGEQPAVGPSTSPSQSSAVASPLQAAAATSQQQQQPTSSSLTASSSASAPLATPQPPIYDNMLEFFSRRLPQSPATGHHLHQHHHPHHHHQQPLTGSSPSEQAPDSPHQLHQLHGDPQHSADDSSSPPAAVVGGGGSGATRVASLLQRRIAARFIEPNELLNDFHALTLHNLADSDSEPEGAGETSSNARHAASGDALGSSGELPAATSASGTPPSATSATSPASLATPGSGADGGGSAKSSPATPATTPRHF